MDILEPLSKVFRLHPVFTGYDRSLLEVNESHTYNQYSCVAYCFSFHRLMDYRIWYIDACVDRQRNTVCQYLFETLCAFLVGNMWRLRRIICKRTDMQDDSIRRVLTDYDMLRESCSETASLMCCGERIGITSKVLCSTSLTYFCVVLSLHPSIQLHLMPRWRFWMLNLPMYYESDC